MKSNFIYEKKVAKKFHNIDYLKSEESNIRNMEFMKNERIRHKTEKKMKVTSLITNIIKESEENNQNKAFTILKKIHKKNQDFAFGKSTQIPLNSNLLNILANESLLITSYREIRKNKGAMTEAHNMSKEKYNYLSAEEKKWVDLTKECSDKITKKIFSETSKLIRKNKYPWGGTSKRIYVDKPGSKNKTRSITIPPFMDKVVETALTIILTTIYEPYFEKQNCSFGFRPNKGVHDAIVALTNSNSNGLTLALEGDINSAYDKVVRKKLIEILSRKIKDKKLLKFIEKRLNYEYFNTETNKFCKTDEGLPQGGSDSSYLWNIYMMVFDEYVNEFINNELNYLNKKVRGKKANSKKNIIFKEKRSIERLKTTIRKLKQWIKLNKNNENIIKDLEKMSKMTAKKIMEEKILVGEIYGLKDIFKSIGIGKEKEIKIIIKNLTKEFRRLTSEGYQVPSRDPNKIRLRFIYVRYADDWIIITNIKKMLLEQFKEKINIFLKEELGATLSLEKTLLTDMRKNSAHFLGFEILTYKTKKIGKYKKTIKGKKILINAITAGSKVFVIPDRQRQLNRLHMKGYCDKNGKPREIGFLSNLDDFSIIERYNSVIMGLCNYYTEYIRNSKRNLGRWIYIVRYSCLKTLAQKHKTSLRKIFKKYSKKIKKDDKSRERTVEVKVINKIGEETFSKTWTLLTTEKALEKSFSLKKREKLTDIFWKLSSGEPVIYEDKDNITNDDYLKRISWINVRTTASFDMPCSLCGTEEEIQMHNIKHVRKNRYELIDQEKTWKQAMALRNKKQIPVCRCCHINIIHPGKYGGIKLTKYVPKVMYDNRIITIESHIHNRQRDKNYGKTLTEKGWIKELVKE